MKTPLSIGYSGYEIKVYLEQDDYRNEYYKNEYYRASVAQFPNLEEYADTPEEAIDLMKTAIDKIVQGYYENKRQ